MRPFCSLLGASVLLLLSSSLAFAQSGLLDLTRRAVPQSAGEELFHRDWSVPEGDARGGDGLGPLFNGRSCVACHILGGPGGAGGNEHNVDILSLVGVRGKISPQRTKELETHLQRIHPGFAGLTNLVLHKESTHPEYAAWRTALLTPKDARSKRPVSLLAPAPIEEVSLPPRRSLTIEGQQFVVTQRNTPALFGAGLIDSIDFDTLVSVARHQKRENPKMAGQIPSNGGRFGWRGQIATLRDFVAGACANELGLQTASETQPLDPLQPNYRHEGIDISHTQIDALTDFIRQLPPPKQLHPRDRDEAESWRRGEQIFATAKCSHCHTPQLDTVAGIYSDLLLHDMGASLADPLPSPSALKPGDPVRPVPSTSYYGAPPTIEDTLESSDTNTERLWRTPPLWGVRDSAPYLHDGRAATIEEAIEMHDGEGRRSADYFRQLDEKSKADLLGFVHSLGVPPESHRPVLQAD